MTCLCACRVWKKLPKHEDFIPTIPIDLAVSNGDIQFARWHVHKDWVLMVRLPARLCSHTSCLWWLRDGGMDGRACGCVNGWVGRLRTGRLLGGRLCGWMGGWIAYG